MAASKPPYTAMSTLSVAEPRAVLPVHSGSDVVAVPAEAFQAIWPATMACVPPPGGVASCVTTDEWGANQPAKVSPDAAMGSGVPLSTCQGSSAAPEATISADRRVGSSARSVSTGTASDVNDCVSVHDAGSCTSSSSTKPSPDGLNWKCTGAAGTPSSGVVDGPVKTMSSPCTCHPSALVRLMVAGMPRPARSAVYSPRCTTAASKVPEVAFCGKVA